MYLRKITIENKTSVCFFVKLAKKCILRGEEKLAIRREKRWLRSTIENEQLFSLRMIRKNCPPSFVKFLRAPPSAVGKVKETNVAVVHKALMLNWSSEFFVKLDSDLRLLTPETALAYVHPRPF